MTAASIALEGPRWPLSTPPPAHDREHGLGEPPSDLAVERGPDTAGNQVLLQPECHGEVHNRQLHVVKPRPARGKGVGSSGMALTSSCYPIICVPLTPCGMRATLWPAMLRFTTGNDSIKP